MVEHNIRHYNDDQITLNFRQVEGASLIFFLIQARICGTFVIRC